MFFDEVHQSILKKRARSPIIAEPSGITNKFVCPSRDAAIWPLGAPPST
jgi:hypothetical protein